jgi:pimeloyl-ACP methyl ester carboxylesterase
MSAPSAFAGNGVQAARPLPETKLVELAAGRAPIYGAAPPAPDHARATFVYLHGVCGLTVNGCGHFAGAPGWLACPQANRECSNGGSAWGGSVDEKIRVIDDALDATRARWPASAGSPVVLVGFSQGAYVAMDVASAQPGRFAGLLLLGADTGHGIDRLRASRVGRVALACGAYDMMFGTMRGTPRALASAGVVAEFASLGNVGHTYVAEGGSDDVLTAMLAWVAPDEAKKPCSQSPC